MNSQEVDEPHRYAIRVYEHAMRDINEAWLFIADSVSVDHANEWKLGLKDVIAELSEFPRSCPLVRERFRREVRHLVYRHYRIFFTIINEDAVSEEPPAVMIMHLRHSASRPTVRTENCQATSHDNSEKDHNIGLGYFCVQIWAEYKYAAGA